MTNWEAHLELGLEDCLYFDDVLHLAVESGAIRDMGWTPKRFQDLRQRAAPLRNDLAHGGTLLDRSQGTVTAALADSAPPRRC